MIPSEPPWNIERILKYANETDQARLATPKAILRPPPKYANETDQIGDSMGDLQLFFEFVDVELKTRLDFFDSLKSWVQVFEFRFDVFQFLIGVRDCQEETRTATNQPNV